MPTTFTGTAPMFVASSTPGSPTLMSFRSAVSLMSATSPGFSGRRPSTGVLGLSAGSIVDRTSVGAPPVDSTFSPFTSSCPWPWTSPSATATPSVRRTCSTIDSGSGGTSASELSKRVWRWTTASIFSLPAWKISSKAEVI